MIAFNKSLLTFTLLFGFGFSAVSQELQTQFYFKQEAGPIVVINGDSSTTAFTGGFHKPIFDNLDINFDGVVDLVVFDHEDDHLLTFIGNGSTTNPLFQYAPQYESLFPDINSWLRIVDFNNDGKLDLFTSNDVGGIMVYKNISSGKDLKFKEYSEELKYLDTDYNFYTNVAVMPSDIPIITDMDNDGDIDVMSFEPGGGNVTFYQNHSKDKYNHLDSFNYYVATYCWGRFQEAATSNDIVFAPDCYLYKKQKHSGSNMIAIDVDNDGDKDVLLSDVSYKSVILLVNGWNPKSAKPHRRDTVVQAVLNYPTNTKSIAVDLYPSMHWVDVDFDDKKDLIVAPYSQEINFDVYNTWYYKNTTSNEKPVFEYKQNDFIQNRTIETGEFSYPAFGDVDGDGDYDLFVASPTPYTNYEYDKAYYRLFMYENVGDSVNPVFKLANEDYLNLSKRQLDYFSPVFGDANNDGTMDLLLGLSNGRLMLFKNSSKPRKPASFKFAGNSFMKIKVKDNAAPCIYDVNHDGKNDLVIGDFVGKLSLFLWDSNNDTLNLETDNWLGINVGLQTVGFSYPRMGDFNNDGKDELLVAYNMGYLNYYSDFEYTQKTASLDKEIVFDDNLQAGKAKDFGDMLSVDVADLNGDSLADLVLGNKRGGLYYLRGFEHVYDGITEAPESKKVSIYPNPANDLVKINWLNEHETARLKVFDMQGREVLNQTIVNNSVVDLSKVQKGFCVVMLQFADGNQAAAKVLLN
ncbi:T9SS type A sorting domain-containing protein [bacterium]|nr:T9SS type A sorting domain-containing protein [bacterium]